MLTFYIIKEFPMRGKGGKMGAKGAKNGAQPSKG